ncbi:MAG: response regulator transcription factor [Bacilli bacterium]
MYILLVEDEYDLHNGIKEGLLLLGYQVDSAYDGLQAIDLYYENTYSLVILDLNLPKIDGRDILKEIRSENQLINIIILSARTSVLDKVEVLNNGANDYLAKPFDFLELVARIKNLSRRSFIQNNQIIIINDIKINLDNQFVYRGDILIQLTNKEFQILSHLMTNKGHIITNDILLENYFSFESNDPINCLKVHIHHLRQLLGKDFIKNKRGIGYYVE